MFARRIGNLDCHLDAAALEEYTANPAEYERTVERACGGHRPMLAAFGQPCSVWLHGLNGCWKYGHRQKLDDDGVDLGDATYDF